MQIVSIDSRTGTIAIPQTVTASIVAAASTVVRPGRPATLQIALGPTDLADPDTYSVEIAVTARRAARQSVVVKLTRETSTVTAEPTTVTLTRNRTYNPFHGQAHAPRGTVVLTETGNKSGLRGAHIVPGVVSEGGRVTLDTKAVSIAPGGDVEAAVVASGSFPLGTSHLTITITSPQLAAPVSIPVDVVEKIHPAWIGLLAALGALAGYLTRAVAARLAQRARAGEKVAQALRTIDDLINRYPDPPLVSSLTDVAETLERDAIGTDPKSVTAAVKTATEAVTAAQAQYEQTRKGAAADLATLEKDLAAAPGDGPACVHTAVSTARTAATRAARQLDERTPTSAARTLSDEAAARQANLRPVETWRDEMRAGLTKLASVDAPDALTQAAAKLAAAFGAAPFATIDGSEFGALLHGVGAAQSAVLTLLQDARRCGAELDAARSRLDQGHERVATAMAEAANLLQSLPPTGVPTEVRAAASAFEEMAAEIESADPDAWQHIHDDVAAGTFARIPHAWDKMITLGQSKSYIAAPGRSHAVFEGAPARLTVPDGSAVVGIAPQTTKGKPLSPIAFAHVLDAANRRALYLAQAVQFAVSLAVAILLAYAAFADTWVGTLDDWVKLLVWGFTIDLSTSALTAGAKAAVGKGATEQNAAT